MIKETPENILEARERMKAYQRVWVAVWEAFWRIGIERDKIPDPKYKLRPAIENLLLRFVPSVDSQTDTSPDINIKSGELSEVQDEIVRTVEKNLEEVGINNFKESDEWDALVSVIKEIVQNERSLRIENR